MNLITTQDSLPSLLDRAAQTLTNARTSGDVLEAMALADAAFSAGKSASRIARAKGAHDDIIAAVYRAQADALLIEARAKARLADEIDAAKERNELSLGGRPKTVENGNGIATAADLGLRRDQIHEARRIRDAEAADPGGLARLLQEKVERGEEPRKADMLRPHVAQNAGNNEWYTPGEIIDMARAVMGSIDFDPASSEIANRTVKAGRFFSEVDDGLVQIWPQGNIWMNPPYAQPLISKFCEKYAAHMSEHTGTQGVVLVNNATETAWFQCLARVSSAVCFPAGRVRFLDPDGKPGAPLQGQAILYAGMQAEGFACAFSEFGTVWLNGQA